MQRARRVALVAVLAVFGVAALAGCRSQPTVAAYVGTSKITEARVNQVVDQVKSLVNEGALGRVRQDVVSWLVVGEVADRLVHDHGYAVEQPNYDTIAQDAQLPPKTELSRIYGDMAVRLDALASKLPPVQPSPEDLNAINDAARANGSGPPDPDQVAQLVGLRNELRDQAIRMHVSVNPKYRPLTLPLGPLSVPLSSATDAL